ncbi:MAG: hypothetical protein COV32_01220 [Candidatus Yonathbacteria bacterium CG10_big_fil_rev_8_21_14_0_10_43_136]|uniref:Uncharacterized protein n=1 Tax=Candidatus Yonathbacteria bacterium CG_4_10_14_0_8_um_filter_43_17 TaxID=1975099 RepID=A0A2M7Q503_9BACT|nr:MAG: hypothetical protein COW60_00855 [Candidatus Yonathbacteria bacterium CG17_big_fil_post_rev_8_21_14_2_50_43_9]PIR40899.1 MAG: hypothetical protein COV32_01220 [Candidatus Yonathbacteria bacterium CG10_big_fil_rev_8_21_14_0_10_43_136]PIX57540.1 MAG: hypothetical protein COZ48_00090 [Candidatus Yonathbacteria bacterium CG_4_10_14_3_um_filter_43_12]PIY58498.1 MAG: hypothetical protein COY98_02095 [Candidatus Yonathbacteria bacterium CG_4_10_14_0_8_um_filter_43_17]PJC21672.1 MAG: hypothetic
MYSFFLSVSAFYIYTQKPSPTVCQQIPRRVQPGVSQQILPVTQTVTSEDNVGTSKFKVVGVGVLEEGKIAVHAYEASIKKIMAHYLAFFMKIRTKFTLIHDGNLMGVKTSCI